jgi:hypothetical protein
VGKADPDVPAHLNQDECLSGGGHAVRELHGPEGKSKGWPALQRTF